MHDKRRQYRVSLCLADELSVTAARPEEPPVPGRVVDLSANGVAVYFDQKFDTVYGIGKALYLRIASRELRNPLVAPSLIHHRQLVDGGWLYGFEFVDQLGLLARLPPTLAVLFNQRRDCRVEPAPDQPIQVSVEGPALSSMLKGYLRDLSMMGLSFMASPALERVLAQVQQVKVAVSLPHSLKTPTFEAHIRNRMLVDGRLCYGLCFDKERTEEFEEKQQKVFTYLSSRHRQGFGLNPAGASRRTRWS